jgi:hypothetical protein
VHHLELLDLAVRAAQHDAPPIPADHVLTIG